MKINKPIFPLFMLLLLAAISTRAQQSTTLSLSEAVRLGLQNSNYLKIDSAKIDEAIADAVAAKNAQLPDFKVSASYLRVGNANVDMKVKTGQNGNAGASPKVNQALYGMGNLSMPIFAGGRIKNSILATKYLVNAARFSAENNANAIALNIIGAYNNLFKSSKTIDVVKENLAASRQRDSTFKRLEDNGLLARNDRLKAQLQTSNTELQLLDAINNYNIANVTLNLLLGLDVATVVQVDSAYINNTNPKEAFTYYERAALNSRKDIQALEMQRKANSLAIKSARAESLPALAVTGGYVAADIPNFITITNAVNIGLGVQYNLANLWKKNTELQRTQAQQKQLTASSNILNDNIRLEVNRDYQNTVLANQKVAVYERALEQALENYRISKNKYDNSLLTITDLLDADAALLSARVNVVNAKADAAMAYQKLLQTTGTINSTNNF